MNDGFYDPIVAEVRKNREELLAEFDGNMKKFREDLAKQRPKWEAMGFRYETEEERQARMAWSKKEREELDRKIAAVMEQSNFALNNS
jgi:hypothetical protein